MAYDLSDLKNLDPNSIATLAGSSAVPGGMGMGYSVVQPYGLSTVTGATPGIGTGAALTGATATTGTSIPSATTPSGGGSDSPPPTAYNAAGLPNYSITPTKSAINKADTGTPTSTTTTPSATTPTGTFNTTNMSSGDLAALTASINAMNVAGENAAQAARVPGGTALSTKASANIGQELAGQLSNDEINQLGQQAAERGINGSNTNADYLKALGLTIGQEQEQGLSDLNALYASSPIAPLFDPTTMLETPYQSGELAASAAALSEKEKVDEQNYALALQQATDAEQAQAEKYQTEEQQLAQNAALQAEKDQAAQALQTKSLAAQYQREILGQQGGYGSTSGTGTNPWAGLANEPGETAVLYGAGGTGYGGYAGYDYGNLQPDNQFYTYSNTGD